MIKRNICKLPLYQKFKILSTNRQHYSALSSDNQHNIIYLLQSCKQTSQTAQIHGLMLKTGLDRIPFPLSKLLAQISMQNIIYAASIFKHVETPNLYMFNTMLRGYSISDDPKSALVLFNRLRALSHDPEILLDQFTFTSVLKSCARLLAIWTGLGVHTVVLKFGFDLFLNVKNTLLHCYCVCERIQEAHLLFDELGERRDLVSWNTLMGGYFTLSQHHMVISLFRKLYREGFSISMTSILGVLPAVTESRNFHLGQCLHASCIKFGFLSNLNVVTALVSMYGKNGCNDLARRIFDEADVEKDVVLFNCLIDGYAKAGFLKEALELLRSMLKNGLQPNSSTLAGLLSACSGSGALSIGRYVHNYVEEKKLVLDEVLGTALVDMYAKSGFLGKANDIFDRMEHKDVRCWTAMISGYGLHGQANRAIALFHTMEDEGFIPNEVTFLAVLNSCSHGGLVSQGMSCFKKMVEDYKLIPKVEHYGCLIDLLGRSGLLEEALELIEGLPVVVDATIWHALLGACRVYGNVDLAKRMIRELEQIHDEHPADSLSLTGTYAIAGMIQHDDTCRKEREVNFMKEVDYDQSEKKEAGCSTIQI